MSTTIVILAIIAYVELKDWNRRREMADLINALRKAIQ